VRWTHSAGAQGGALSEERGGTGRRAFRWTSAPTSLPSVTARVCADGSTSATLVCPLAWTSLPAFPCPSGPPLPPTPPPPYPSPPRAHSPTPSVRRRRGPGCRGRGHGAAARARGCRSRCKEWEGEVSRCFRRRQENSQPHGAVPQQRVTAQQRSGCLAGCPVAFLPPRDTAAAAAAAAAAITATMRTATRAVACSLLNHPAYQSTTQLTGSARPWAAGNGAAVA